MATLLVDIANNAAVKIGGFGDQLDGSGLVTTAQLTANADRVSQAINVKYPIVRKKVIADFAALKAPFRETQRFADLNDDLKQDDIEISSIVSASTVVTVTTKTVHGRATGAKVFLADIKGAVVDTELNGTIATITVTTTTAFSLDSVAGVDATWDHTADTGIVSFVPEMGPWEFAFNLPSDYFAMVRQTDEVIVSLNRARKEYPYQTILNIDGDGLLLLTDDKTNADGDSAYIEYAIDQESFALFSPGMEEAIAMLLAVELSPFVGRDPEFRQALLAEYKAVTVPDAMRNNQSQHNNEAQVPANFLGGRTTQLSQPRGPR